MNSNDAPSDPLGSDDLVNLIGELRMMARQLLNGESHKHSFTPTELAISALRRVRLKEQEWKDVRWENRAHFFSALAKAMRHALIDYARRRNARGRENIVYLPPDEIIFQNLAAQAEEHPEHILRLHEAFSILEAKYPRLAHVLDQFYFIGHTIPEIARCDGVSEKTIDRDLQRARVVLRKILEELL
ncbi:MAG TPA: ECF-type sigma factor [Verrucomicrobiae bacterium]|jgi:RNA polymerase sigma factor (TIGR02999 family)